MAPSKKREGVVAGKLAGFALMEESPRSPRRMRMREECNATAPRKKHAGIVAGKLAGVALMEESPRSPRRMRMREECSVTAPSKKHAGIVERSRRTVGAASTDRLCRVARPIAKPEAVAASVLEKRRSGIVVAKEDQYLRRRRGRVILRPNVILARSFPMRMDQSRAAPRPPHVLPQRHGGGKIYT